MDVLGPNWKIPRKRNELAGMARGEFIAHFDSDDFSHPDRLAVQMKLLEETGKQATGFYDLLFAHEDGQRAWRFVGPRNEACGSSYVYAKAFWEGHRFEEMKSAASPRIAGSDYVFIRMAHQDRQLVTHEVGDLLVMRAPRLFREQEASRLMVTTNG